MARGEALFCAGGEQVDTKRRLHLHPRGYIYTRYVHQTAGVAGMAVLRQAGGGRGVVSSLHERGEEGVISTGGGRKWRGEGFHSKL